MTSLTHLAVFISCGIVVLSSSIACTRRPTIEPAKAPTDLVVRPGEGLGAIRFGDTQDEVRAAFGQPDRTQEHAWEYLSKGFAVVFNKEEKVRGIFGGDGCLRGSPPAVSPLVEAFKGRTVDGVGMGSSRAEIEVALGKPKEEQEREDFVDLQYPGDGMSFRLYRDRLIYIMMRPTVEGEIGT